jgi:hypothetical protein
MLINNVVLIITILLVIKKDREDNILFVQKKQ